MFIFNNQRVIYYNTQKYPSRYIVARRRCTTSDGVSLAHRGIYFWGLHVGVSSIKSQTLRTNGDKLKNDSTALDPASSGNHYFSVKLHQDGWGDEGSRVPVVAISLLVEQITVRHQPLSALRFRSLNLILYYWSYFRTLNIRQSNTWLKSGFISVDLCEWRYWTAMVALL